MVTSSRENGKMVLNTRIMQVGGTLAYTKVNDAYKSRSKRKRNEMSSESKGFLWLTIPFGDFSLPGAGSQQQGSIIIFIFGERCI